MKSIKYLLAIVFVLVGIVGLKAFALNNGVSAMPILLSIEITSPADKLSYTNGEELNIDGLEVTGTYNDDTTLIENITLANVTGFDSSAVGQQILTITVGNKTTTYTVNVEEEISINPPPIPFPVLMSIEITNSAERLSYKVGEGLDLSGLEITGTYRTILADGSFKFDSLIEDITLANITGFDSSAVGAQVLTITVGGKTATFTVNVEAEEVAPPTSGGGGGSSGGRYVRPVVAIAPVVAPVAGEVLGLEKFVFTLFLKQGSVGNEVMELQKFLNTAGFDCGVVDGKFGPKTKSGVMKFQTAKEIQIDGIVGPQTRGELNK